MGSEDVICDPVVREEQTTGHLRPPPHVFGYFRKRRIFSLTLTLTYSKTYVFDRSHEYDKTPFLKVYSLASVFKNLRICGRKHHLRVDGEKNLRFRKYLDSCGRGLSR